MEGPKEESRPFRLRVWRKSPPANSGLVPAQKGLHPFIGDRGLSSAYFDAAGGLLDSLLGIQSSFVLLVNKSRRRLYDSLRAKVLIRFLQEEGIQTIVVGVQFAESERSEPLPSQRKIALDLCNMGRIEGVVFYPKGLRDLLAWRTSFFDQIHQEAVRQAYILRLYFYRRRLLQIEPDFFT